MQGRSRFHRSLVVGLVLGALAAPVAQAAERPYDRAGGLGVATTDAAQAAVRSNDTDVVSRYLRNRQVAGDQSDVVSRYLTHSAAADQSDVVSRYLTHSAAPVRPDEVPRAGIRGGGPTGVVTSAADQSESFWGAGQLAAAASLGALTLGLLGFALMRRRRAAVAALQS
jgi:hypothetical protein